MDIAVVTTKGHVVIPAKFRKNLVLKPELKFNSQKRMVK